MLIEQKYKDQQSKNSGNTSAKLWLMFQLFPSPYIPLDALWSSCVLSCPPYIYLFFPEYV
jgi:hypothetical protein